MAGDVGGVCIGCGVEGWWCCVCFCCAQIVLSVLLSVLVMLGVSGGVGIAIQ